MISIITHPRNKYSTEYLKYFLNSVILKRKRGPQSVVDSLARGLKDLNTPFKLNPSLSNLTETVVVISGVKALREAIAQKKLGKIKKLYAGPCITVLPSEEADLMLNEQIDKVIVPSAWVKDLYISFSPQLENKIMIWPAGVKDISFSLNTKDSCLVYKKNCPEEIFNVVEKSLKEKGVKYTILDYGTFKQETFFNELLHTKYMIYLSPSESQGLALQEAWIRDVPTLVWDRGLWTYKDKTFKHEHISAPYLSSETGLEFNGADDFPVKLEIFIKSLDNFTPRAYSLQHFTDKVCAKLLIDSL